MLAYPNDIKRDCLCESDDILVLEECYCPNGHNLVTPRANFSGFPGIVLKVKLNNEWGTVALSPIYCDKSKISFGVDIHKGDIAQFYCPDCGVEIPSYCECSCGASIVCMFLDKKADYRDCIGICSRVGCFNARVIEDMEDVSISKKTKI